MSPSIDFGSVKGLEPIPAGNYLASIIKAESGQSKAGNQKIDIQWKIDGGQYDGRVIFESLVFTEKTLFRVKNTLLGLGFDKNFNGEITSEMLVNKVATISVDIEISTQVDPETGEPYPPRNRIKKVQAPKAGGAPSLIPGKKK